MSESQEYKNSELTVTTHRIPGSRMQFKVVAMPGLVKLAHQKAVKRIAKSTSLPGFRKGKTPEDLVLKNFPEEVDKAWQETLAEEAFRASEKLVKAPLLNPQTKISFEVQNRSLERGAELTLSFETDPEVPSVDPKQITLNAVKRPEVNEEKVEETIRQTQLFFAKWITVDARPVQEGDFVRLDVDIIEETPHQRLFANTRFEVADKSMAQWMKKSIVGLSTGDSAEGVSEADSNESKEVQETFKPKKVRITVRAIETSDMPVLDEKFAQQLGVKSVEDLRTEVRHLLDRQADQHVREELRDQIGTYLLEHYNFDLPNTLIEKETQFRFRQIWSDPQFQKYWESIAGEERKKIIEQIYHQSERAVKMFYLCRKILTDAHITISPNDLPKPPTTPLEALLLPRPQVQEQQNSELQQAEAYSRLLLEKAEDYIIEHASQA